MRFATALIAALLLQGAVKPEPATRETRHLRVALSASADHAAPGRPISLYLDVTPKPTMHVYAPGQPDYVTVSLKLDRDPSFTAAAPKFPPPEKFLFEPLNEQQLVYMKRFRVTTDVTPAASARGDVTVKGTLRYQACDEHVCYLPQTVTVEWTIAVRDK